MSNFKRVMRSPVTSVVLFALAAVLLLTGTIGSVRAAPLVESNAFSAQVGLSEQISASIVENGQPADGELLGGLLTEDESFCLGKEYDEALAVVNDGDLDEYIRVTVYRYWTRDGEKDTYLEPELIVLGLESDGWILDSEATTPERYVLYYTRPLAVGESTPALCSTLVVNGSVATKLSSFSEGIPASFDYSGVSFHLRADVDAVQTHNAQDAILSAWGRPVEIDGDGVLTLANDAAEPALD